MRLLKEVVPHHVEHEMETIVLCAFAYLPFALKREGHPK